VRPYPLNVLKPIIKDLLLFLALFSQKLTIFEWRRLYIFPDLVDLHFRGNNFGPTVPIRMVDQNMNYVDQLVLFFIVILRLTLYIRIMKLGSCALTVRMFRMSEASYNQKNKNVVHIMSRSYRNILNIL
jgi:hypothetical protein